MNSTHCISYVDGPYLGKKQKLEKQMSDCGWFESYKVFTKSDLSSSFVQKYKDIFSFGRGAGYWIWKPYIISECLKTIKDGDFLIYMDGGCTIVDTPRSYSRFISYKNILNDSGKDMIRFEIKPHTETQYTNTRTLNYFKDRFGLVIDDSNNIQLMATIMIIIKNQGSVDYFNTVLDIINDDPFLITDTYNSIEPHKEFKDHRHDQSICSLLTKSLKNGLVIEDDTWYENFDGIDNIPFLATRKNT